MGSGVERIQEKIRSFKKKYYLNLFIRGVILSLSILIFYFLVAAIVEHNLWLGPWARFLIFFSFVGVAAYCIYRFLREPLQWWFVRRGLSEEESAKIIGSYIPTVKDRLLNLIQLNSIKENNALAFASMQQKSVEFEPVSFDRIIDLGQNKKYLKFLAIPVVILFTILVFNKRIITQSTERLVHYNRHYAPEAPFQFMIKNSTLTAFYNEDFVLNITLTGSAIPSNLYLNTEKQRFKVANEGGGNFSYTFENLQEAVDFQLEGAGFFSDPYHIAVENRPELAQFKIELAYPRYLQRKNQQLINSGNLEIPEGTVVRWKLMTAFADAATIEFAKDSSSKKLEKVDNQHFTYKKQVKNADVYTITLHHGAYENKDKIAYSIDVIKDQYPSIVVNNLKDSVLFKRVMLGGLVADDYGISRLALHYQLYDENQKQIAAETIPIAISKNQAQQSFYYNWSLDSLTLQPGTHLEYYLQVWDNDGINGRKSTRSANYTFHVPTEDNLVAEIKRSTDQTGEQMNESSTKAQKLHEQIEQATQKLKGKQTLDWQDKKMLEDIIQQKQSLDQMLEQAKDQHKLLEQKKEAFTEQDERIREKAQQIQKLMEELLDEETKKLFEELQRLLKENTDMNQLNKLLNKLNQNTNNLEKELERTLQLFKELQFEYKLDQTLKNLAEQIEKQKSLLEKTESLDKNKNRADERSPRDQKSEEKNSDQTSSDDKDEESQKEQNEKPLNQSSKELAAEQEKLQEDFKETQEKLEELKQLSEELHKNDDLPSEENSEEILQEQQKSKEMLQQNKPSKAKTPQKNSLEKMQQMQEQMQQSQQSMGMEMEMENLESLRQIIHGLVKLSFDQENLMKQFGDLSQNDPGFNTIAQNQLKLKDDAKVIEDSLLALGKRDPFMGSIVTKEVTELKNHLDRVIEANKERRRPQASSEMQASMASINNLALMLDNHFDMMMQMMANAQPSMKKSKQKGQKPSLSQMQQQLNERIEELKNSKKSGRQLSEELAEMAAEQERIRKALQEMQEKMNDGKMPGDQIPGKMEQTEMDLVNKRLTDQLIKRQREILTRLLEAEKSIREQDQEEQRKGETAKDYDKEIPKAFEEYLRLKEKEVELLKTVPPKLYPYYKKEVSEYFKRMGN